MYANNFCGRSEIRTRGELPHTRFPSVRHRPLGHPTLQILGSGSVTQKTLQSKIQLVNQNKKSTRQNIEWGIAVCDLFFAALVTL